MHTNHSYSNRSSLLPKIRSQGCPHNAHVNNREDLPKMWLPAGSRDVHCPVCLQMATYPVETNCGHLFCAPCLISYWKHCSWLDAISCPLCRQTVKKMCHLFSENKTDCKEREVLRHVRDYNKRYSGAPRQVKDYLCDAPLFLLVLVRGLGNMGGLVWLFLLRVAVCGFGAAMSLAALPGPLSSALGILDDFVVVFLLLICIININQQMGPQRTRTHSITQGVLTDTL
ncbi:RING-HC_RNF170 domain-containing protein [Danio rerio]|uniref:RING-HC_RNF170 domain-containing protein n=1 Tax=Danio rerio TaxID=7955 RepID=Q5TZ71_DANRE|nr:RING-HC_RNF170 domain-containing protein [Danio rerio]XP_009299876.1 novel zinc finger protein isoform X1 [Danio rerio]|eukprot:NP_001038665.1 novel zinc finger protein [Danio rerio]